eukprot:CAMPEP_0201124764 /NCGR_PEP_ID=MMETSP0850-20130426/17086_1 /ASSEMBLY_ACC=CAM_ASM_000622 /TAXON_ID=183588 /ORGANISM="Pseudo-nitzschia fraudulenta, Strain WWA7" /LENGTH=412 /DNA_ID=CAMNT_0047392377 /DNA_START=74 /DNA_END=1312 /DNA_ORIENTATION=-
MKVHRTTLQLAAIAATAAAFVPRGPEIATRHISFSPPSIVSLADGKSGSSEDGSSTSSPARSYLEDSSLKEPESYLDDMASGSDGSGSSAEEASESVSSEYLEDMVVEDLPVEASVSVDEGEDVSATTEETSDDGITEKSEETLVALLRIAASTGRGEFADNGQKDQAAKLVSMLEANNPTPEPTNNPLINGRWELVYSSSQLFRSSPFFMAGRAVCGTKDQADQYDWFCDMHRRALAISNIGTVRQIISPTLMVSEFEVKVGAVPFLNDFTPFSYSGGLPFTIDGSIVSQADITPTEDGNSWELLMDTVQIKGSNIPGLRTILDNGLQLQSRGLGSFLENNLDGYTNPRPVFETTYLTDSIRISRDQDGKIFVYAKESDESTSTDYSKVEADLGVLKLLGGFNDAVTKFYI